MKKKTVGTDFADAVYNSKYMTRFCQKVGKNVVNNHEHSCIHDRLYTAKKETKNYTLFRVQKTHFKCFDNVYGNFQIKKSKLGTGKCKLFWKTVFLENRKLRKMIIEYPFLKCKKWKPETNFRSCKSVK